MKEHNRQTKVTFSVPQKSSFSAIWKFGPKLGKLLLQAIISHDMLSEDFEMLQYDGIQYLDRTYRKKFTQKVPSRKGQLIPFGPTLSNLIFHDSLSDNFFEFCDMIRHNTQTKVTIVKFSIKVSCSRDLQKHFSIMECNSQTLVKLVNSPRKLPFWARGNLG